MTGRSLSRRQLLSRRQILKGSSVIAAGAFALHGAEKLTPPAQAQAVTTQPSPISPALIDAARKEGKLAFYTAMDLPIAEKFGKTFEAKFPGIAVRVERSGAERVFQRIGQEMESRIHAVDIVNSADGAHFITIPRNSTTRMGCGLPRGFGSLRWATTPTL
jgi:iron(III) transport system substrate-binding protein